MPEAIVLERLRKAYGTFVAVDELSLAIGEGELVGLLGPNGAGKTTAMRMLMGLLKPSAGRAEILGRDCFAERAEVMRAVGYVPDEPAFHDYLTGRELLRFVGGMHGLPAAELRERATRLSTRLSLAEALDEYAVNYSKGMKKKLAVALALVHRPRVLILDEPTNGLDPYATRELHELMRELAAEGATVLFSTHLLDQVERLAGRVAIMDRGKLVAEGSIEDLRARSSGNRSLEAIFFAVTHGEGGGAHAP